MTFGAAAVSRERAKTTVFRCKVWLGSRQVATSIRFAMRSVSLRNSHDDWPANRGFTFVELLVVTGAEPVIL